MPSTDGSATLPLPGPETAPLEGTIEPEHLVVIEPAKRLEVFTTPGGLDPIIQAIAAVARKHRPDVTTKKGREAIASNAYKVARCKSLLDDMGKEETTKAKTIPNQIDASRRDMRTRLEAVQAEVRKPLTDWEAEQDRQRRFIEEIQASPLAVTDSTAAEILDAIASLEGLDLSPVPDFQEAASAAKAEALDALRDRLQKRQTYESEQAELARLREAQAKRDQEEREAQIRKDAEERAKKEAEAKAQAEKEAAERRERDNQEALARAQREKDEAEQRAKDAEARAEQERKDAYERAEQARIEAQQDERRRQEEAARKEKADREARERDVEHRRTFNREAWMDVQAIILAHPSPINPEALATEIVRAIASDKIRHIKVIY
jgi:hypothetical protein